LRRSLVPSLLAARRTNETLANPEIELFEIARSYLRQSQSLPQEELLLSLTSGGDFRHVKGVIETVLATLNATATLECRPANQPLLSPHAAELWLNAELIGYLGEVSEAGQKRFELRGSTTVAELKVSALLSVAGLVPKYAPLPALPATTRDVNLLVDDRVRWADLAATVRQSGGPLLDEMNYLETYRSKQLGAGKKKLLMSLAFRKPDGTLTNEEADRLRDQIVAACSAAFGAELG
jgi:phenylalanyl-tRNA synthetase beta chain